MDSLSKSFNPNKHLKEEFVSNLTGSSMLEIAVLLTVVPVLTLFRHSISSVDFVDPSAEHLLLKKHKKGEYILMFFVDYIFIVAPTLLFFTVLSEWTFKCAILLTLLLVLSVAAKRFGSSSPYLGGGQNSFRSYVSSSRVLMMIMTCLCILAVDFRIFPRKFAKTETYGTSLMDVGVGSFVMANAFVSRQARDVAITNWKTALKSTSPLIFLGFARVLSTAGVDYQVHAGEYGVHWNFFFTLAAVSILSSTINISPQNSGIVGALVLTGYQCCLMLGLNTYMLSNERGADIVSQNKEGIFSIFGYWGMYLIGVWFGNYLLFRKQLSARSNSNKWARNRVWISCLLFWLLTILLDRYVERVSRRLCNMAYVTFIAALNLQVLGIVMLSDFVPGSKMSVLEHAFNQNLLGSFLVANVLTGLINLFIETLFIEKNAALILLLSYAFVFSSATGLAELCGIRLKYW